MTSLIPALFRLRRTMAAERWSRDRIRRHQERRLRTVIRFAYDRVAYYRRVFDDAGVSPESIATVDDLDRIPVTTRAMLQDLPAEQLVARGVPLDELHSERSSGSEGRPLTVVFDRRAWIGRSLAFYRALRGVGYRVGHRLLLLTSRRSRGAGPRLPGWRYASIQESADRLAEAFLRFRPNVLYGCVTPLRMLAEELSDGDAMRRRVRAVVTTAETLDRPTRRLLEDTFSCQVFDFYGVSEVGLIGFECGAREGYHLCDDRLVVQQVPSESTTEARRLVLTCLDSFSMPLIRYDTGDLGVLSEEHGCSCGRTFSCLERVEGRAVDRILLANGRAVSPYRVTCALEAVEGIGRFHVVQPARAVLAVTVEQGSQGASTTEAAVRNALIEALGAGMEVTVTIVPGLDTAPGRKFRVVESRMHRVH